MIDDFAFHHKYIIRLRAPYDCKADNRKYDRGRMQSSCFLFGAAVCGYERRKSKMPKENIPMKITVCTICGRSFTVPNSSGAVRCPECRNKCRSNKDTRLNRPFTRDTVFLVCKWYGGGNTVSELAELLNRSESNIEKALREGGVVLNE